MSRGASRLPPTLPAASSLLPLCPPPPPPPPPPHPAAALREVPPRVVAIAGGTPCTVHLVEGEVVDGDDGRNEE